MSKVEALLAKYKNSLSDAFLSDIADVYTGKQINKSALSNKGLFAVINGGIEASGYTDNYNEEENTITISQGGASAGYVNWNSEKIWIGAHCYAVHPKNKRIDNRFLYFVLKEKQGELMQSKQGAGIPGLNRSTIQRLSIPLPHIKVQEEIVKILDSFTNLIDALNEELSLRQKQFEYYREKLLTYKHYKSTAKPISELAEDIFSGATPSTKKEEYWTNGDIPWMSSGDIHQKTINDISTFITKKGYDSCSTKMVPISSIVIALAGQGKTRGTVGITNTDLCTNQSLCAIVPDKNEIIPKFLFYYFDKEYNNLRRISSGDGTRGGLNLQMIRNYIIEYPSLAIQQSIVSKLDAFESLISSLKEEIALRQKQYEYYREKLLTFE